MMSVSERIEAIMKHGHHKNAKALSMALGMTSAQVFYDIQSGKVKSISSQLANKIILVYPEFNMGWLLTGQGEMLNKPAQNIVPMFTEDAMQVFLNMSNTILRQEENISKLADMVNRLTGGAPQKEVAGL